MLFLAIEVVVDSMNEQSRRICSTMIFVTALTLTDTLISTVNQKV